MNIQLLVALALLAVVITNLAHYFRKGRFLYPAWVGALILALAFMNVLTGCEGSAQDPAVIARHRAACAGLYEGYVFRMEGVAHRIYWLRDYAGTAQVQVQGFEYTTTLPCYQIPKPGVPGAPTNFRVE